MSESSVAAPSPHTEMRWNRDEIGWIVVGLGAAAIITLADARTALTVICAVALAVGSMSKPAVGLSVLIATVPVQDGWPARLGSMELPWTRIALFSFGGAWLVRFLLAKERIRMDSIAWAMLAFCGALALSVVNAVDAGAWAEECYRWLVAALVYVVAASCLKTELDRLLMIGGLVAGVMFSFVVAVYQVTTSTGPETFNQHGLLRAYGMFGEPNPFAGYLEIATLPLLAIGFVQFKHRSDARSRWIGVIALSAAGFGCAAVAMTQSRGGLLGFAAGLATVYWFLWPRMGRRVVLAVAAVGFVIMWTPPFASIRAAFGLDGLLSREPVQVTTSNWAAQERLAHWGAALRMWEQHPWFGVGAGNFPDRFREFTPNWRFRISRGHAHSAYLQAASQAGVVGLVCFVSILCAAWRLGLSRVRDRALGFARGRHIAALAVTAAIAVHGLFDYLHVLSLGIVLSAVWAMSAMEEVADLSEPVGHGRD